MTDKHYEILKKIVRQEGGCQGIACVDCPFVDDTGCGRERIYRMAKNMLADYDAGKEDETVPFNGIRIPEKGQTVIVSDDTDFDYCERRVFACYIPESDHPIFCVSGGNESEFFAGEPTDLVPWKYFKFIPSSGMYEPYKAFDTDWIGRIVDAPCGDKCKIIGNDGDKVVLHTLGAKAYSDDYYFAVSFDDMLNYKLNGEPFGELDIDSVINAKETK